jgi:UDPglucose 6-dehydrogenase
MADGRIAVIGAGYVGLTSAACLAELGHEVVCCDADPQRVAGLLDGRMPILEDGLQPLVASGLASGRLSFVLGNRAAVQDARYILLCLPTPDGGDGRADLRIVHEVVAEIGPVLRPGAIVITKSTVPVGTARALTDTLGRPDVAVVSNPEFLREGSAVRNFMHPDRVVVGYADRDAAQAVADLYAALNAPVVITSAESSELIKYASNAFLAVKLSFVNAVGGLAEAVDADIAEITHGMGFDARIGGQFLQAGPGWGGSCFPKDVRALAVIAADHQVEFPLLGAAIEANDQAQDRIAAKVRAAAGGSLAGVRVALWGLTFKAGTDDLRDSPALEVARRLAAEGAVLRGYDPAVTADLPARGGYPAVQTARDPYAAADGAAVIVVLTEWPEFTRVDLARVAEVVAGRVLVDGRNLLDPAVVTAAGFTLIRNGRPTTEAGGSDGAGGPVAPALAGDSVTG